MSEEHFHNIFTEAPIGMAIVDREDHFLQVNKAFCEMLGYDEQELTGYALACFLHPEDVEKETVLARLSLTQGASSYKAEKRYVKKDQELLCVNMTATMLRNQDEQVMYGLIMFENIMERKRVKFLEEERHHVAYELHDRLAQVVAGTYQHLQAFASRYQPRSPQARQQLDYALELAQHSVKETRRLIAGLLPTALNDLGLEQVLRIQIEALRNDGWTIVYEENLVGKRLPSAIETTLFWVAQEALTNIYKHAHTMQVRVVLVRQEANVSLIIQDWGSGFESSILPCPNKPGEHVGIRGMYERVELIGGNLVISSQPGIGTLLVVEVPVPRANGRKV